MQDKLVVDTNIFVEAIFCETVTDSTTFLANLDSYNARLVFSQETIGELMYILKRECNRLRMPLADKTEIMNNATALFIEGKSVNGLHGKQLSKGVTISDKHDEMFVDAAFAAEATHIITHDKKSGILKLSGVPFICCKVDQYINSKSANII